MAAASDAGDEARAGSSAENHAAALAVMGLYPPQLTVTDTCVALLEGGA